MKWPWTKSKRSAPLPAPETDWNAVKSEDDQIHHRFVSLFSERYRGPLIAVAAKRLEDERLLDELFDSFVQDRVMTRRLQNAADSTCGRFRDFAKVQFRGYVIDYLRRELRRPDALTNFDFEAASDQDDPAARLERDNAQELFDRASEATTRKIEALGDELRLAVWRREISPIDGREAPASIANRLGVPVRRVYYEVQLCRESFRQELQELIREEVGYKSELISEAIDDLIRVLGGGR